MDGLTPSAPGDCAVLVGIDLTDRDEVSHGVRRELAHARLAIVDCQRMGAWVPSLEQRRRDGRTELESAARRKQIVIVIAHHDPAQGVQWGDGFMTLSAMAAVFGPDFGGTIDLAVCLTAPAAIPVFESACPHARVVAFTQLHRLAARASVVRATMRCLAEEPAVYIETQARVLEEMAIQVVEHRQCR